jgi:hypothetical protein
MRKLPHVALTPISVKDCEAIERREGLSVPAELTSDATYEDAKARRPSANCKDGGAVWLTGFSPAQAENSDPRWR